MFLQFGQRIINLIVVLPIDLVENKEDLSAAIIYDLLAKRYIDHTTCLGRFHHIKDKLSFRNDAVNDIFM